MGCREGATAEAPDDQPAADRPGGASAADDGPGLLSVRGLMTVVALFTVMGVAGAVRALPLMAVTGVEGSGVERTGTGNGLAGNELPRSPTGTSTHGTHRSPSPRVGNRTDPPPPSTDQLPNGPHKFGRLEGLGEEGVDPDVETGLDLGLRTGADDGEREIPRPRIGTEPSGGTEPVEPRHDDIEGDDIGPHLVHEIKALGTIRRGHDLEPLQLEIDPDQLPDDLVVVHNKHPPRSAWHNSRVGPDRPPRPAFPHFQPPRGTPPAPTHPRGEQSGKRS